MAENIQSKENISERLEYELRFKKLANAIHSATSPNEIMVGFRDRIPDVYQVEMATIFLIDAVKMQLVSWVLLPGKYLRKIRVPIDKTSIIGYVASTRNVVLISDAYDSESLRLIDPDLRFDSSWDRKTGVRTRQVLAAPIMFKRSLQGVIQLMNKRDGDFTENDKYYITDLADTVGIAFRNLQQLSQKAQTKYDMLIKDELISDKELDRAIAIANQHEKPVEDILINNFRIPKDDLGSSLATYYNTRFVDPSTAKINIDEMFEGINVDYLRKIRQIPLSFDSGKLVLATEDPSDHTNLFEMKQVFRADEIEVQLALRSDIDEFYNRLKPLTPSEKESSVPEHSFTEILDEIESDALLPQKQRKTVTDTDKAPVVRLVNKIIEDAYRLNASDIHIEPYGAERDAEVRYRVDGQCVNVLSVPRTNIKAVVARFKILADLDISERRLPQDGKIKYLTSAGKNIELRMATIPTADKNEDVVLRVLADSKPLPLKDIMPDRIVSKFETIISKPYGIVLVVGPTGSGKTTTLHSALSFINTPEKKIWTAEDPVEISQYRLRQVQIHSKIGLTFASAMRAFLRADPDVIMVGEMRDEETAKMGVEASLTGHLVFSTLHTNSASETITRLIDMGMDPFNFADALLGILAQRLVKTLCPKCRQAYRPDQNEYNHLKKLYGRQFDKHIKAPFSDKISFYKPKGCDQCNNIGYKGRAGLYELLIKDDILNKLIIERATVDDIKKAAIKGGMTTLMQEGIQMIFSGKTDFKQVMRVCAA